jgi:hypothetical protein
MKAIAKRARAELPVLSPEAHRFADEGYVNLLGAFANVDAFNRVIEAIVRENASKPVFMRYEKFFTLDEIGFTYEKFASTSYMLRLPEIHALSAELLALIDACRFEDRLAALLPGAPRMELLQSLYFPFSSNQASHSDKYLVSPRPYKRETLCGLWLALDGSSRLNGALFGWSGSHKVAAKPELAGYENSGDYSRDLSVAMVNAGLKPRFIYADPGDVVVWASDFVHGGASPLVANIPRRSLVLHYGAPEAA